MRRKIFFTLAPLVLIVMLMTQAVQAVEPRLNGTRPKLSFDGTTAVCQVTCRGKSSDEIDVTLTLYQGSTYVTSWSDSGTGHVSLTKERTVTSGKSYTLKLTYSINDAEQDPVSVTARCP